MGIGVGEQTQIPIETPNERDMATERHADPSNEEENKTDGVDQQTAKKPAEPFKRDWRFWTIISTLTVIGILSSLENTVVVTSLPVILDDLAIGENYIWITNVFFLTG